MAASQSLNCKAHKLSHQIFCQSVQCTGYFIARLTPYLTNKFKFKTTEASAASEQLRLQDFDSATLV